jgi:hypothetical protein
MAWGALLQHGKEGALEGGRGHAHDASHCANSATQARSANVRSDAQDCTTWQHMRHVGISHQCFCQAFGGAWLKNTNTLIFCHGTWRKFQPIKIFRHCGLAES